MKKVDENINFERGQDPKDAMGIGSEFRRVERKLNKFLLGHGFVYVDEKFSESFHGMNSSSNIIKWEHKRWPSRYVELIDLRFYIGTNNEERNIMINMHRGSGYKAH